MSHKAIFKGVVLCNEWNVEDNINKLVSFQRELKSLQTSSHIEWYVNRINQLQDDISNFKRKIEVAKEVAYRFRKIEAFFECELSKPELIVGEEIYINDLDIVVSIKRKYRTINDNEVIYETDHVIRIEDDEHTEKSRLHAVNKWFELSYKDLNKFEDLKKESDTDGIKEDIELLEEKINEEYKEEKPKWFKFFRS